MKHDPNAEYLGLILAIKNENSLIANMGSKADLKKLISLIEVHIKEAEKIGKVSEFQPSLAGLKNLDTRLDHFKATGIELEAKDLVPGNVQRH